jgi:hypothetical protein
MDESNMSLNVVLKTLTYLPIFIEVQLSDNI